MHEIHQKHTIHEENHTIHKTFKKILRAFKSDFILYAHEWSGIEDEGDSGFNLQKLKDQMNWKTYGSDSIWTFDKCYFEKI